MSRKGTANLYHRWNPAIAEKIYAFVRAGCFPHVAAQAAGLPLDVFKRWFSSGNSRQSHFHVFRLKLLEAQAQARVAAEIETYRQQPEVWLRHGPGKETTDSPGWSNPVKAIIHNSSQSLNVLLTPELAGIFGSVFQLLAPYPDALKAVQLGLANLPLGRRPMGTSSLRKVENEHEQKNTTHENRIKTREMWVERAALMRKAKRVQAPIVGVECVKSETAPIAAVECSKANNPFDPADSSRT